VITESRACGILKLIEYVTNKKAQIDVSLLEQ